MTIVPAQARALGTVVIQDLYAAYAFSFRGAVLAAQRDRRRFGALGLRSSRNMTLQEAVAGDWRAPADKARDPWRHPVESLEFWGLKPGQTVVEFWPGAGWYTDILAPYLAANGGKLMQPHIVKSMTDPATKTTTVTEPKLVRRVISEETSRKVNEYLEQVVSDQEKGTGRNAYIEGYRVAGKTGTAQKVIGGNYSADKFLVSFIGYAPVEDPKIVVYILVDEPNDPTAGGGRVAAPAFREIVLKSLRKMGVAPSRTADEEAGGEVTVTVPDLTGMKIPAAKAKLKAEGTSFELVGDGGAVLRQIPSPGTAVHPTQKLYLITEQADRLAVPDLTGVSLRDAAELTSLIGARLVYEGSGYVISQKVTEKDGKRLISVVLSPPEGAEGYIDPESLPAGDEEAAEQTENPEGEAADGAGDGGTADGGDGET